MPGVGTTWSGASTSIRPNRSSTAATSDSGCSAEARSAEKGSACPPSATIRRAVSPTVPGNGESAAETVRAHTAIRAPSLARRRAIAAPIPRLAPVTSATRPSSSPIGAPWHPR